MVIVHRWEDGPDFIYKVNCSEEQFIDKMAKVAGCDPEDVKDEWFITEAVEIVEKTFEEFFE